MSAYMLKFAELARDALSGLRPALAMLDSAAPGALQRVKLAAQLAAKVAELVAMTGPSMGGGPRLTMNRARLAREILELLEQLKAPPPGPDMAEKRLFYVTMIRDMAAENKVARLAGPFDTKEQAEEMVQRAREAAAEVDPRSVFDAFGVTAITEKSPKAGVLNGRLGLPAVYEPPAPPPDPLAQHRKSLVDVVDGRHDSMTLLNLWALIHQAVEVLTDGDALTGENETLAHRAITRWAELEEQTNG